MSKGSEWERDLSDRLSFWWSGGAEADLFWRTAGSGGRATARNRRGKRTRVHCGDICATTAAGEPLLRVMTIETKRGYARSPVSELLDKPAGTKKPDEWEIWVAQAVESGRNAGTPYWCIIAKRDRREPLIYLEEGLVKLLPAALRAAVPAATLEISHAGVRVSVYCVRLDDFFRCVPPEHFRRLAARLAGQPAGPPAR